MSLQADLDLVRRDPDLPGLATLLDPALLAQHLGEAALQPDVALRLLYLRYKPGTNCLAAYRLGCGEDAVLLYAKAHGARDAAKLCKAGEPSRSLAGHCGRKIVSSLGLAVFTFPDDARLKILSRFADPSLRERLLVRILGEDQLSSGAVLETLAYKPERRFVSRYKTQDCERDFVLKFYLAERFSLARRTVRALESRNRLRLPEKCGGSKRYAALALRWLPGQSLRGGIDAGTTRDLSAVGEAIAELHGQSAAQLPASDVNARAVQLSSLAQTLAFIHPVAADPAYALADQIACRIASLEPMRGAIHGDFYDKQVLLLDDQVAVVDLDDAACGDVRQDLGLFIAHLELDRIMRNPQMDLDSLVESLVDSYQSASTARIEGLASFVADGLFRLAHHPFRYHVSDWPSRTDEILGRVGEILADAETGYAG